MRPIIEQLERVIHRFGVSIQELKSALDASAVGPSKTLTVCRIGYQLTLNEQCVEGLLYAVKHRN